MRVAAVVMMLAAMPAIAAELAGHVTVTDGDSLRMGGTRVRLWGIDAPELDQVCPAPAGRYLDAGRLAAAALSAFIGGRPVLCATVDTDRYGRTVAACTVDGADIGRAMVRSGFAWDYARYSGGHYRNAELKARHLRRGIWAAECIAPWDWRRR